jgi:glutathione peroxidase-family protein
MQQWHLTTEPWTFVVDRRGRVSSRFQGALSVAELTRAVERVAR